MGRSTEAREYVVKRSWLLVASALIALFATTAFAYAADAPLAPFDTNAECLQCHSVGASGSAVSKVDFAVLGGVDLNKCSACHKGNYLDYAHPHFTGACENCHNNDDAFYFPWPGGRQYPVNTPYGHFLGLASLSSTPAKLHAVHSQNGSWVNQAFSAGYPACASCHATAACTACHEAPIAHGDHATPTYPGLARQQANGVTAPVESSTCIDPACHSLTTAGTAAFTPSCGSCHPTNVNEHGYEAPMHESSWTLATCGDAGCHSTRDLLGVHTEKNPAFGCSGCHGSTSPKVIEALDAGLTGCGDCHEGVTQASGHDAQHWANPLLSDGSGPHYGYETGSASTAPTSDCTGCHTSNLIAEHIGAVDSATGNTIRSPRFDARGDALTCASCHSALAGSLVANAIATGQTKCDACHVTHKQIPATHTSMFAADPAVPCAPCHSAQIEYSHNGTYSVTTASGKVLTGCEVCHSYYEGSRGAEVQAAIADANDTKCTSCHAGAHPDKGGHSATSSESLGCGSCHAEGQSAIDARAVHSDCAQCHDNPNRVPSITGKTAECASCHASAGEDYHRTMGASHTSNQTACAGQGGCHVIGDIAGLHSSATTTVAGVTYDGCGVCHQSSTVQPTSSDCTSSGCHGATDPHPAHLATESDDPVNGCMWVGCHYTTLQSWTTRLRSVGDLKTFHAAAPAGECAVCHANPTRGDITVGKTTYECAQSGCHADKSPLEPNHYPSVSHDTTDAVDASGFACSDCHYLNVKSEHDAFFHLGWTCTGCHQYGYYAVAGTYGAWNKTCGATGCHSMWVGDVPTPTYHTRMYDEHNSQSTECAGSDCHNVTDVKSVHADATLVQDGVTYTGCKVCHTGPEKSARKWTAACTECHTGHGDLGAKHSAVSSPDCAQCHAVDDVRSLHASSSAGPCKVCHDNPDPNRIGDLGAKTAECASCHATVGSDYHTGLPGKHIDETMAATCQSTTCHVNSLPEAHESYIAAQSTYATTCALCHANNNAGRIPANATAACASCHDSIHPNMDHSADDSQACVDCHETGDVMELHKTGDQTACALCHGAAARVVPLPATADCVNCHAGVSPADPNHYAASDHLAADGSEGGYACSACHGLDLKVEHSKSSVSPTVTCVSCHETKVDALGVSWNQNCAACHAIKHGAMAAKHTSSKTACGGSSCHPISDVAAVHAGSTRTCGVCHGAGKTPATDCATAGCHPQVTGNHEAKHDTAGSIDSGCKGCHFEYLTKEHAAFGYTCATCHSSTSVAVKSAISAGNRSCDACHPAVNGKNYHLAQNQSEFITGNSSGHRVRSDLPGMRSSFRVNATSYSWSLPTASSFLKTGWTTDSIVTCDKCHTYTGATGPHGSTAKVNIDPAYPGDYQTAYLGSNGPSPSNVICAKCHTNLGNANNVHRESDHQGSRDGTCVRCHSKIPHGWRLPRMLAYTNDPVTYASTGLTGIRVANHTPSGWSENDCATSCGEHSSSMSSRWPSIVNTVGTLRGSVKSSTGVALAGVVVTTDKGYSATTSSSGVYDLGSLPTGAYQVTAVLTGYVAQTLPVTVTTNAASTADFTLTAAPASTNLSQGKTAAASSTYSSNYAASKAFDGSTSTYWRSTSTSSQWVRVDLGSSQSLKKFVVDWNGSSYARSYRIETSADGSNWTSRYSTSSGNGDATVILTSPVSARYVRLYCTSANSSNYQVAEFQVWNQ